MISPLLDGSINNNSFTLDHEKTESGFVRFRFKFQPLRGFWLCSEWFVPSTSEPDTLRLIAQFLKDYSTFHSLCSRLNLGSYFEDLKRRISVDEQVAYIYGGKPLTGLTPLDAACMVQHRTLGRVKEALAKLMHIEDLCVLVPQKLSDPERYYAYRRGMIWESPLRLTPDQWKPMIDSEAEQRGLVLNDSEESTQELSTRFISVTVRRDVWRRDQGKCVVCGSQERMEFDHIIPVAMGGSNTARNVQLLCESCNRAKAATLG